MAVKVKYIEQVFFFKSEFKNNNLTAPFPKKNQ